MNLRPFFGYYGGKWRDAVKLYPPPLHDVLVEPFAGSAGYATRHHKRKVILCERDPVLVGVWQYLIHASPREIRRIPDVPNDGCVDDLKISQEAKWLVGFWMNRGTATPRPRPSRWMREGIRPGSFWGERVRETIAAQVESIRHWKIYECSYEDSPVAESTATWFIDPPYTIAGKHYRFGSELIDYLHLAAWCRSRRGQVIVCENKGAKWLPFEALGNIKTTRSHRRSKEVCWTRDSETQQSGCDAQRRARAVNE